MVFCFSFFTYNIQRFIKSNSTAKKPTKTGSRLEWIYKQKNALIILSAITGITGLSFTFFIHPSSFIVLIPMGFLSFFYVVPIIPFYNKIPRLREIPYLKIFVISFVWSLIVIALPKLNSLHVFHIDSNNTLALLQVFFFTIAITLPFDIRDMDYDQKNLKTIPLFLGVNKTIILSEILLLTSITLLYISDIAVNHFFGLLFGHILTMIIISFSNQKRKELFFAGLVEGTVIILYTCLIISDYFSYL